MATLSPTQTNIALGALAVVIAWRLALLPKTVSSLLDQYVPKLVADTIKGAPPAPPPQQQVAAACPPKSKCEDYRTNAQCGLCPSACEWFDTSCRSRGLTPTERNS